MSKETILKPEPRSMPDVASINTFADNMGKRAGGGVVQVNIMTFSEIANMIVLSVSGFDKQSSSKYDSNSFVLSRIFKEYGWPTFETAIVLAGVRKYVVDPKDGFIPLAPGSIDIEAALKLDKPDEHRELQIFGDMRKEAGMFKLFDLNSIIGFATEYGNGPDSLETIIPIFTPGIWSRIEDTQFDRPTGMVIVTPHLTLWCENMNINNLAKMPIEMMSVKMREAVKIAEHLCEECDIK